MSLDWALPELYEIFFFLKSESNFGLDEMLELFPFELEIYFFMAIKDYKRKNGIK